MKSIRIGNDIRIEWPIVLSGDVSKLKDLDLTVEVRPSKKVVDTHNYADDIDNVDNDSSYIKSETTIMMNGGVVCRPDIGDGKEHCKPRPYPTRPIRPTDPVKLPYYIENNTLIAMWTADRQFAVGDYDIIVYAHKNGGGQAVADTYRFVRLVPHTAQADGPDNSGIEAVITMQPLTLSLSGLSAYEVAVVNGFQGSVEEWLESLKAGKLSSYVSVESIDNLPQQGDESTGYIIGTKLYIYVGTGGDTLEGKYKDVGEFRGPQGAPGSNGKSAYELAVEGGYEGSVEEWLASLNGTDGEDGITPLIRINNNRFEQSTDNGEIWSALSDQFDNRLYIKGYAASVSNLPKNALIGDIYGVGPVYMDDDSEHTRPYYQMYINTISSWDKDNTITKVYQGDTELPQSAENNEIILIKKSTDNYLVYKYSNNTWNLLANLAEIYVKKEDIINRGDNVFALVQSEVENQYELYKRTIRWVNFGTYNSISAGIVQTTGTGENVVMSQKAVTENLNLLKSDITELDRTVFPLNVSLSVSPTIVEAGISTEVTINWNATLKGQPINDVADFTLNSTSVKGTTSKKETITDTTPTTKTYTLITSFNGRSNTSKANLSVVGAMYFGFDAADNVSNLTINALGKQNLKTTANGTYTLQNSTNGHYMWLCIPNNMNINRVTLNGFDVPMEEAATKAVGDITYKCYRSSNALVKGNFTIIIA